MALNTFRCNCLRPLHCKGLTLLCPGVHTVANIDHAVKCSYVMCLLGACVPLPVLLLSSKLDAFLTYSCLCSVITANLYGTQIRHQTQRTRSHAASTCPAWLYFSAANLLMTVMLISALYHNCSVRTRDGVEIPLKDAFHNMLVSPAWAEFRRTVRHLLHCLMHEGLHKFVYEFRIVLDPEGENSSYRVNSDQCYGC